MIAIAISVAPHPGVDTTDWPEKMWMIYRSNHQTELVCGDVAALLSLVCFAFAAYRLIRNCGRQPPDEARQPSRRFAP